MILKMNIIKAKLGRIWEKNILVSTLIMALLLSITFFYLERKGVIFIYPKQDFYIIAETPGSGEGVTYRGAIVDDVWYNASNTVSKNTTWIVGEGDTRISVDGYALKVKLPIGKRNCAFIFNIGPNQGIATVTSQGINLTFNLVNEIDVPTGGYFDASSLMIKLGKIKYIFDSFHIFFPIIVFVLCFILRYVYEKYKEKINWNIVEKTYIVLLLPIVANFLANTSVSSSPLIPENAHFYGYDGAAYLLEGRSWANGLLPYRDIFELKGPLIFLVYRLGDTLNPQWGVFIIQVLSIFLSIVFSYKIGKKIKNVPVGIISSVFTLIYYGIVMDEGALIEDFNLPYLMISTYFIICYLEDLGENILHPYKYAFFYGLTIGASIMLRATNCMYICVFVLCIMILLIVKKQYKNLRENIVAGVVGLSIAILPFAIYFLMKGAFYDFLYGTIIFEIGYTSHSMKSIHSIEQWRLIIVYVMPVLLCLLFSLEQKRFCRITIAAGAIAMTIFIINLNVFHHYYVIFSVFVPVSIAWMLRRDSSIKLYDLDSYCLMYVFAITFFLFIVAKSGIDAICGKNYWLKSLTKTTVVYSEDIKNQNVLIPLEDRDKVIAYNLKSDWYLISGIYPCCRWFNAQDYYASTYQSVKEEIVDFFESLTAEWVVVGGEVGIAEVNDVINKHYEVMDSRILENAPIFTVNSNRLTLYHKK